MATRVRELGSVAGPRLRDSLIAATLGLLILGPALVLPGFVLQGDMVFVPDQPWKSTWLGADGSVPRAVPSDAIVSFLGSILPGTIVQKGILFLTVFLGAIGMARLVADRSQVARAAAMILFVWNPFVYARLAIGHWALLVGYAALPWAARAALDVRRSGSGWMRLAVPLLVAAWSSPTGGLIAALVALFVLAPCPRLLPRWLGLVLVSNMPWLVPGILNSTGSQADAFGVSAFSARADTPWGAIGSLVSLGGMWKESVDAPGRDSLLLSGAGIALVVAGLLGLAILRSRDSPAATALGTAALTGLLMALLPTWSWGQGVVEWIVTQVPGGGLLRDSQKFVAMTALGAAAGLAHGLDRLRERWPTAGAVPGVSAALLPMLVLPGLGWGLLGTLAPAQYPDEWRDVRMLLESQGAAGQRTVVLPFSVYRRFDWNRDKAVLDPAPRFFPGEVLTDDALVVTDGTVAGEDPVAARLRDADSASELARALRREGVAWALVHRTASTDVMVPPGEVVHAGDELILLRLPGNAPARTATWAPAVVIGSLVSALFALWLVILSSLRALRAYTPPRENHQSRGGQV